MDQSYNSPQDWQPKETSPAVEQTQTPPNQDRVFPIKTKRPNTFLIAVLAFLLGLILAGGAVYFWKNSEVNDLNNVIKGKDTQVSQLRAEALKAEDSESTETINGVKIDDEEILKILTVDNMSNQNDYEYWLPVVTIKGDYAETLPIPVKYDAQTGYTIPAMGGVAYYWNKVDGNWKKMGSCGTGECQMEAGYTEAQIPKELTE